MSSNQNNINEEMIFGDFVDYNISEKIHNEKINNLYNDLLKELDSNETVDEKEEIHINTDNYDTNVNMFDLNIIDKNRCNIIYNQLFECNQKNIEHISNPNQLEEYLNKLFHDSMTYNHLIQVLNIDITKENNINDNKNNSVASADPKTMLHINDLTEKIILFIKKLGINNSIDDIDQGSGDNIDGEDNGKIFNQLKSKYTSLIVEDNEHLSILTDPHIFNLTMDLIKEKITTQNLVKDNEVYKNIVKNFIEQSQRQSRIKIKHSLAK
ncbi:hypothetical protein ACO0SA_002014 [Hanseniaspora valbyensis]